MKPLEGIKILDLSRVLAAPLGTMILGEMGATIWKVEQPGQGDETRINHPFIKGESGYYFVANRGKQSMTLNLKMKEAQEIVRDLARQADVVVENYKVGTLKRFGLDYESLKAINPKLVYVSLTGFGQDGPYADRRGYDTVVQAMRHHESHRRTRSRPGQGRPARGRPDVLAVGHDRHPDRTGGPHCLRTWQLRRRVDA